MQKNLIEKIKQKKELSGISSEAVQTSLDKVLSKYRINLEKLKKADEKIIIKEVRADLRRMSGMFQLIPSKKENLSSSFEELLKSHSSTSERLSFYPTLKKLIKDLNINSILELGCGLNPLALADKDLIYHASDINEKELEIIKRFFKKNKVKGNVFVYDLRKIKRDLPSADICLIFKVLDLLPSRKKTTEEIFDKINSKYFLISFSTRKLSGKKMNRPTRIWFEKILEKKNLKYEKIIFTNEIFYLIAKDAEILSFASFNILGRNE